MSLQRTLTRSLVMVRTWPVVIDMGVGLCALALFIAIVHLAAYWMGTAVPVSRVSENARSLPVYAFYSVMRIGIAYVLSLVFAIAYGYIAARNARAEAWMIAVLDILQSIPVLSFLPPVLLAMNVADDAVRSSLRFSLGATTTAAEIDDAANRISQVLRHIS